MAKRRQPTPIKTTVADAVSTCFSELEQLGSELRDWHDNLPENLQGGEKGEALEEAASALENISEPTIKEDDELGKLPVEFSVMPPKRNPSRSSRRDDALRFAQEALDVLNAIEETSPLHDDAESLVDEIQQMIDEAEGVEFPGMY